MVNVKNHGLQLLDVIILVIDAKVDLEEEQDVLHAQKIENLSKIGEINLVNVDVKMVLLKILKLRNVLIIMNQKKNNK